MPAEKSRTPSVTRAASIGLALGISVAGIVLMFTGLRTLSTEMDCPGPNANECLFQQTIAHDFARWQMWLGLALELLAVGTFLWIRASDRKATRESPEAQP